MSLLTIASRNATRASSTVIRNYSRSVIAAEPTLHNATGKWEELLKNRPEDEDYKHKVFHHPFNAGTIWLLASVIVFGGFGSMVYGVVHQQYKQGFWKNRKSTSNIAF